ncbi:MAG TPA: hypothetical protein VFA19_14590 [Gaiellaceae bacterium]|nr:hypothetical protein [Gaiellaceae bacterium]
MTPAERYLLLGLRLGRHVDGIVDSYYGPAELKEQADREEPVPPEVLAAEGDALLAELDDGWLRDLVRGAATYAHVLAGEPIPYADEVEACFGVRPRRIDPEVYAETHARLEELLPGEGPLGERRQAWREQNRVPEDKLLPVLRDVLADLRARTQDLFGLPDGEEIELDAVDDEPWWAFNYYQGGLRSRVVVNVDVPTTFDDVLELAAHEGYPGHHTERSTKEVELVRRRGALEETLNLVPTPQSLVAEGIAETAVEVLGDDAREAFVEILRVHGIEYDVEHALAVREALRPIRGVGLDAALLLHEDGASVDEVVDFVVRNGATTEERARHNVRFALDPTWRAYAVCYSAGGELARAYHRNDPARFARLLREHVRVPELLAS